MIPSPDEPAATNGDTDLGIAGGGGVAVAAATCCDDDLVLSPLMRDLGAAAVGIGSAPPPPPPASAECCRTNPWCWWCLGSDPEVELLSLPCWAPIPMPSRSRVGRPAAEGRRG